MTFAGKVVVRKGGLEPPPLAGPDPKSGASANSATFANCHNRLLHKGLSHYNWRIRDIPSSTSVSFGVN